MRTVRDQYFPLYTQVIVSISSSLSAVDQTATEIQFAIRAQTVLPATGPWWSFMRLTHNGSWVLNLSER